MTGSSDTGAYEITAGLPGVTEVHASGGIFGDLRYRRGDRAHHEQALMLWTIVVSRPTRAASLAMLGGKR